MEQHRPGDGLADRYADDVELIASRKTLRVLPKLWRP
jgi:hypothetical protein